MRTQCVNILIEMWVNASIPPLHDSNRRVYDVYPRIPSYTALLIMRLQCIYINEREDEGNNIMNEILSLGPSVQVSVLHSSLERIEIRVPVFSGFLQCR